MKINLLFLSVFYTVILSILLNSCNARKYNVPTQIYICEGADTVLVKEGSLQLDSLRILVVNNSNTDEQLITNQDLEMEKSSSGFTFPGGFDITSFGTQISRSKIDSEIQSQFYNELLLSRVLNNLQSTGIADLFVLNTGVVSISTNQLDSIVQNMDQIDLVMVADSILFHINSKYYSASYEMDTPFYQEVFQTDKFMTSGDVLVSYKSYWRLLWLDESTGTISKEQQIVQTGQYFGTETHNPMKAVFACALKAGDDFCRVFVEPGIE